MEKFLYVVGFFSFVLFCCQKPPAPGIPTWSPIQVLTGPTLLSFLDQTQPGMFRCGCLCLPWLLGAAPEMGPLGAEVLCLGFAPPGFTYTLLVLLGHFPL